MIETSDSHLSFTTRGRYHKSDYIADALSAETSDATVTPGFGTCVTNVTSDCTHLLKSLDRDPVFDRSRHESDD